MPDLSVPYEGCRASPVPSPHWLSHTRASFIAVLYNSIYLHANSPGHPNFELSGPSDFSRPVVSLHRGQPWSKGQYLPKVKELGLLLNADFSRPSPGFSCLPWVACTGLGLPACLPVGRVGQVNERTVCMSRLATVPVLYKVQSIIQNPFWGRLTP